MKSQLFMNKMDWPTTDAAENNDRDDQVLKSKT